MKHFSFLERISRVLIRILPLPFILRVQAHIRPTFLAKLISSFKSIKLYEISIQKVHFFIESGPRDDHYLDFEKNQLADWEDESLGVWLKLCKTADVAIDVGAYLGVYSILAAKVGSPKVYAIEPNPETYLQLERNILINSLGGEISTSQFALGDVEETVFLVFPHGRPLSSGTKVSRKPENENPNRYDYQTKVHLVPLDSLIVPSRDQIVVMKIDVEGFELQVLKGATNLLLNNFPEMIIEILSNAGKVEIDIYLERFGYSAGVPIRDSRKTSNFLYKVNENS